MTTPNAEQYELSRILAPRLTRAAKDLREQADRLAELAVRASTPSDVTTDAPYTELVGPVLSGLMSTLANIDLSGIVSSAGQADVYRAKGQ